MAVKIFICYASEDEALLNKLKMHLIPLQKQGLIEAWHDRDISAGTQWEQEITEQLNRAQIILLLISPAFMDSNYCYGIEMQEAIKRHERKNAQVIPVILRPVYWHEAPFGRLQALPRDAKPVISSNWHNWDDAFIDVAEGIRKVLIQRNEPKSLEIQGRFNLRDISGEEKLNRTAILTKLRQLYVLSHDNISSGIMAGTEPLPKKWVEEQLEKMGEIWRQDTYYGEIMELSTIQRLFIQTIFDYFHEQGTWPTYGYVEREISQIHRDFDMRGVSRSLPSGFANAFAFNIDRTQEALLKVPAMLLCKGSEHDLADFVQVLQYCVKKYFSFGENNLQVTSDEVRTQLNMSGLSIRKVGRLIEAEGMFWSSLGRNDIEGSWVCALTPGMEGIARFDKVETIGQYLEKLDQFNKAFALSMPQLSINGDQYLMEELSGNIHKGVVNKVKVLFLAANPKDTLKLRLDEEIRSIDLALRQTEFRNKFDIKQHWAVRVTDLQSYLLRHQPDIVHFSGHGNGSNEIFLEDNNGNSHAVSARALSQLFSVLKDNIRCVILNACYSEQQAQAIAKHIDCVIGMPNTIGDQAAISFSAAFYQALGYGRTVKTAFDLGCVQIDLEHLDMQNTPKLLAINSISESITFV